MKHIRELSRFLARRWPVEVQRAPHYTASHPLLIVMYRGRRIQLSVSGTPADKRRDALNTERDMRRKFREIGVELERRP